MYLGPLHGTVSGGARRARDSNCVTMALLWLFRPCNGSKCCSIASEISFARRIGLLRFLVIKPIGSIISGDGALLVSNW